MDKADDGMKRIADGIADGSIAFNQKTLQQYENTAQQMSEVFSSATAEDLAALKFFDDTAARSKVILEAHGLLQSNGDYHAKPNLGLKESADFQKAQIDSITAPRNKAAFCRGEQVEGVQNVASDTLKEAYTEAEHGAHKLVGKVTSRLGIGLTQENGWSKAFKKNVDDMNGFKAGLEPMERVKAFGRGSVAVGAAVALGDAALRSKDSEGEDRSSTFRVIEAVAAGLVGGAALLHGRAMAR